MAGHPAETVYAQGGLFFFRRHGGRAPRTRPPVHPGPRFPGGAGTTPSPYIWRSSPALRALYLDAEHEDGYHQNQNSLGPGVTIEDDMAVLVRYASGATLHVPPDRVRALGGLPGVLQRQRGAARTPRGGVHVVAAPGADADLGPVMHGAAVGDEAGRTELLLRRFWEPPQEVKVPTDRGPRRRGRPHARRICSGSGRGRGRSARAGGGRGGRSAGSLVTGLAANRSLESGLPVRAQALLDV